jgi:hypothetical protein
MKVITRRRLFLLPAIAFSALIGSSLIEAYVLQGHKWGTSTVRYYVNPASKWVSPSAAVSAVQTAAAGWNNQSQANIELAYAGTTNGSSLVNNGKNEVFFRNTSSHVAETYYWWDGSGRFVDGDIVFNEGGYQFFSGSGCVNGIYIENVAIHEFGHILGLLHSDVAGVTMQPAMQSYCDQSQLSLEPDDIAGIEKLYPPTSGGPAPNTAPAISITGPTTNLSFTEGTVITFSGSASDSQDGSLTSAIRWTSSLSGLLGTGGSLSRTLPIGIHVITAAVTDSGGLSASQQILTTVIAGAAQTPPPSSATLSARGYKVKGLQKADLTWSGLAAGSVDIYRGGSKLATVGNGNSYTDAINRKGGGTYSYQVCGAGTTTCTNNASVSF